MTQWGLDTLFNPAKRHMDEEKRRLQSTREEVGDNSGGRRVDLESGKVVIRRADKDDEAAENESAPPSNGTSGDAGASAPNDKGAGESAANGKGAGKSAANGKNADTSVANGKSAANGKSDKRDGGKSAPSAAAQRAAARRGRTAR